MQRNKNRLGYKKTKVGWIPEDWECLPCREISKLTAGGTPSTKHSEYWGGEIPWMNSGELKLRKVNKVNGRITEEGLRNSSTKYISKQSVLIGLAGQGKTRGTVAINEIDLCTNQSVAAIIPNPQKTFYQFLYANMDSRYESLRRISAGDGGRGGLNLTILGNLPIPLPSILEQKAIAEVLECWDKAIWRYKKKIKKKRNLKKGLMQRLLSGNQRLPGFEGEWKEVKLGKCGKFFKGKGISKDDVAQAGLPCIRYGQIYTTNDHVAKDLPSYISSEYTRESTQIQYNDLLLTGSGETIDEIGKALAYMGTAKAYAGGDIVVLRPNLANVWADYLAYYLNTEGRRAIRRLGQGQSVVHVYSRDLMGVKLPLPPEAEQRAIATVLSSSDAEISTLECKLATLQDQKRFLLNNMVMGTIRLPQFIGASKPPDVNGDTK